MNLEEAKHLGDRHLIETPKFDFRADTFLKHRVRISATEQVAATVAGQHALWMLTNLLSRQFMLITDLVINVPCTPLRPNVAHFGGAETLDDTLLRTAQLIAGNAMHISSVKNGVMVDAEAIVGNTHSSALFSVGMVADGWKCFVGNPSMVPDTHPRSDIPFGPYWGACVVAGEVFKHLARLRPGKGVFLDNLALSLWDFKQYRSWDSTPAGESLAGVSLPPFYLAGCGAVGQAAVASLAGCPSLDAYVILIDHENIDASNRNRYVLAHRDNLDQSKVHVAAQCFRGTGFQAVPYAGTWEDYVQRRNYVQHRKDIADLEAQWKFQRVLSCVDKNTARHGIQNLWPEVILGGSTYECGIQVQYYDLRTGGECLKCFNPVNQDTWTIEAEIEKWRGMSFEERKRLAQSQNLNLLAIEAHLARPQCGQLGEQEIAKFGMEQRREWSVGFVSAAAGILLAAKLIQSEMVGFDLAFPASRGQALRFNFLNPGPCTTKHPRKPDCSCGSIGLDHHRKLWSPAAA